MYVQDTHLEEIVSQIFDIHVGPRFVFMLSNGQIFIIVHCSFFMKLKLGPTNNSETQFTPNERVLHVCRILCLKTIRNLKNKGK